MYNFWIKKMRVNKELRIEMKRCRNEETARAVMLLAAVVDVGVAVVYIAVIVDVLQC